MNDFTFECNYEGTGMDKAETYNHFKKWADLIASKSKVEVPVEYVYLVVSEDRKDYYGFYEEDPKIEGTVSFKVTMENYYKSLHDSMVFGESFFETDNKDGSATTIYPFNIDIVCSSEGK